MRRAPHEGQKPPTLAASAFGLSEERRGMLLHKAVQRGLFRAVAFVVDRGAIRRPLGLPADGLHARLPKW
jgi:hypothetical protein